MSDAFAFHILFHILTFKLINAWALTCLVALRVFLSLEQITQGFFSSPLCPPYQGLSSACQDGVSPWPWWPVLWCWVVSCWCPGWPTSVVTGRSCKLSSSAPSCSCCPTSGKIKRERLLHLATDSRLVEKDLKPCRQLNLFAASFQITSFFLTAVLLAKCQAPNTYEFPKIHWIFRGDAQSSTLALTCIVSKKKNQKRKYRLFFFKRGLKPQCFSAVFLINKREFLLWKTAHQPDQTAAPVIKMLLKQLTIKSAEAVGDGWEFSTRIQRSESSTGTSDCFPGWMKKLKRAQSAEAWLAKVHCPTVNSN